LETVTSPAESAFRQRLLGIKVNDITATLILLSGHNIFGVLEMARRRLLDNGVSRLVLVIDLDISTLSIYLSTLLNILKVRRSGRRLDR